MSPGLHLTDTEVEALLGAYALDACEPDEAVAIEVVLARRPDLAQEAARLARAANWIGVAESLDVPASLRTNVIGAIRSRDARGPDRPAVDLYRTQSERFEDAVQLTSECLDEITANGLRARDLVIHEAAQETLLADAVGAGIAPEISELDIVARTAAFVALLDGRPLDDALDIWRRAVDANCAWASRHDPVTANWRGLELDQNDAMVVRAFETWIHTDDLRRVAGFAGQAPEADHLALMSDLAGRSLSLSLAVAGRTHEAKVAKLVLTGEGGGDWLVAMDGSGMGSGDADVTLTVDAVDWCLLVGDRIAPPDVPYAVEGDAALGDDLLAAAPAFATL